MNLTSAAKLTVTEIVANSETMSTDDYDDSGAMIYTVVSDKGYEREKVKEGERR